MAPEADDSPDLVARLRRQVARAPEALAFCHLADGELEEVHLTRAQLERRAAALAHRLQETFAPGSRLLLVFPSGLDFVTAFWGCLFAGMVAVPVQPPASRRARGRVLALVEDAAAAGTLTTRAWWARATRLEMLPPCLEALTAVEVDQVPEAEAGSWSPPDPAPDHPALLQYTSGSTRTPRGVAITRGNLAANVAAIRHLLEAGRPGRVAEDRLVSWLPVTHDMGLIGAVVAPPLVGGSSVLLPPLCFLQRPVRWLQALTRFRGTVSAAPDFALDLTARRVTESQLQGLDLSSWSHCFDGAEPIRAATVQRFQERFQPVGLGPRTLGPTYGLAEATLLVTGRARATGPRILHLDPEGLARGRAVPSPPGSGPALVSCGPPALGVRVRVVTPGSAEPLEDGRVGEVWVAGPSVAGGYHGHPEDSIARFQGHLPGDASPWLRTGDLGFLEGGELFVTGRLDDLLVIRGRNHYPQDLEATATSAHPTLEAGRAAAFQVEAETGPGLVLAIEPSRHARGQDRTFLEARVRAAIAEEHGLSLHAVVWLPPGTLPLTPSGKIQRNRARAAHLAGELVPPGAP